MFDWLVSIFTVIISFFSKLFGFSSTPNVLIVTDVTASTGNSQESKPVDTADSVAVVEPVAATSEVVAASLP
jgi:hypothetical protein